MPRYKANWPMVAASVIFDAPSAAEARTLAEEIRLQTEFDDDGKAYPIDLDGVRYEPKIHDASVVVLTLEELGPDRGDRPAPRPKPGLRVVK